jgi:hypothetical protein
VDVAKEALPGGVERQVTITGTVRVFDRSLHSRGCH